MVSMRSEASVLHLDLDAFFAAVEQRDKPSLRGKPVVVGGIGQRGVVATASYEARTFGVRSAMPAHEARRRCPNAAFLTPRFEAYREASRRVMAILHRLSPLVEPLSLDEAFVDLRAATRSVDLSTAGLTALVAELKAELAESTGGLTASVGVASSKFMAKVASELDKPDGSFLVTPGEEVAILSPMRIGVIPGVGPVTADRLNRIGVRTVRDLQQAPLDELIQVIGRSHGHGLKELAYARDDRPVEPEREAKSISVEDTFATDLVDVAQLQAIIDRDAHQVASRLQAAHVFARTVTLKVRLHDFTTFTRSKTLLSATDRPELITELARSLLAGVDITGGVRLLGVGVAGLTDVLQEDLFVASSPDAVSGESPATESESPEPVATESSDPDSADDAPVDSPQRWSPGLDIQHAQYGPGWIWGAGLGRVTVRFETRHSGPGPVRTFTIGDPELLQTAPEFTETPTDASS